MSELGFGYEQQLKRDVAAQDSDLVALYELEVFGVAHAVEPKRADAIDDYSDQEILQLRHDIMRDYGLHETDMPKVIAAAIGSVVNIKQGKDFFDGQA